MRADDRSVPANFGGRLLAVDPGALQQSAAQVLAHAAPLQNLLAQLDRAVAAVTGLPLQTGRVTGESWRPLRSVLMGQRDRIETLGGQLQQAAERLGGLDR